jgi:hypothetical protein
MLEKHVYAGADVVLLPLSKTCELCRRPYRGRPHGCPNYDAKPGCPPSAKPLDEVINLDKAVDVVVAPFAIAAYAHHMKRLHPTWTDGQCRNLLRWQGSLTKQLRDFAEERARSRALIAPTPLHVVTVPEAHGVDVTATCEGLDVFLEWPPVNVVYKVMLVGRQTPEQAKGAVT